MKYFNLLKANIFLEVYSSYFEFYQNKTLVSYKAKKNKVVLMLSILHSNKCINESMKQEKN